LDSFEGPCNNDFRVASKPHPAASISTPPTATASPREKKSPAQAPAIF